MRACSVAQSCLTLCSPMDCSPPGFSVHGIFQARILEWVAISYSRGFSDPGIEPKCLRNTTKVSICTRLPWWLSGKESTCQAGDTGSIPESGRSPGGENGNPLQYSCMRNPMQREAWWATVHGAANATWPLNNNHQYVHCFRVRRLWVYKLWLMR